MKTNKEKKDECISDAIHKLVTLGMSDDTVLEWVWEQATLASRESRQLSAVPSEEIESAAKEYYDNEIRADCDRPKELDYDDIIEAFCSGVEWKTQRGIAAVLSDFTHRIFIIMSGDKELERIASADVAIDLLLLHQNGEYPNARIFKMKIK